MGVRKTHIIFLLSFLLISSGQSAITGYFWKMPSLSGLPMIPCAPWDISIDSSFNKIYFLPAYTSSIEFYSHLIFFDYYSGSIDTFPMGVVHPTQRTQSSNFYYPKYRVFVMFGGYDTGNRNDLWAYNTVSRE